MVSKRELNEKDYVKEVYEEIGHHFDATRSYKWGWIEEFLAEYDNTQMIYDIGCGSGRNLRNSETSIGFDNCDTFIDICKKKGLNAVKADMTELPVGDSTADAIISIASFHHLYTYERRKKTLLEMYRVLKPGGEILLSVWSKNQPAKTRRKFDYGDNIVPWNKNGKVFERFYYIFKMDELQKLFEECGLKVKKHVWDCGNEVFTLIHDFTTRCNYFQP